ncbi:unnamed protein product [Moneuplotes crassus]|uniref:MORN repeat protein n=2 Tax=Euplotes crassus TaxID=5936 RepID=A0AAD1XIW2_EUPCR|nr:unnamed protein product [Moneuplotes crassus]
MSWLRKLSETVFCGCSPAQLEEEEMNTSVSDDRKKGHMVENEGVDDSEHNLFVEDASFDFSLVRKGADNTIATEKVMKKILKNVSPAVRRIYKVNGPFKYCIEDWYNLGLDKEELVWEEDYNTSSSYCGELRKGTHVKEGKGVYLNEQGDLYEGFFKHGRQYGKGRMIFHNNSLYQGDFKNGVPHGFGIFIDCESGGMRKAEFKQGKIHGEGIEKWADGTTFKGFYRKGKKSGFGVFRWGDGSSYEGDLEKDLLHGLGTLTMSDGRKYEGHFADNNMDGEGTFYWPDGRKYVGSYKDGKKHGKGKMMFPDGQEYYGEWVEGEVNGSAFITDESGKKTKQYVEKGEIIRKLTNLF